VPFQKSGEKMWKLNVEVTNDERTVLGLRELRICCLQVRASGVKETAKSSTRLGAWGGAVGAFPAATALVLMISCGVVDSSLAIRVLTWIPNLTKLYFWF
jgi:hypothetical protein